MRVRVKCPAHCPPCHAGGPVCRAYNGTRPQKCSWPQLSWAPGSQQICLTQVTHAGKKIFLPHCFENPGWGSSRGNGKHRKCCGWVGWFFEEDNHRYMHRGWIKTYSDKEGTLKVGGRESAVAIELKQPQMDTLSSPMLFLSHNLLFLRTISVFYASVSVAKIE